MAIGPPIKRRQLFILAAMAATALATASLIISTVASLHQQEQHKRNYFNRKIIDNIHRAELQRR